MAGAQREAEIDWVEGLAGPVPVSRRYGDPFYSLEDGLAETAHVFLLGNRLPERWEAGPARFTIAELGFGTGLGFLAAWRLWRRIAPPGAVLDFVSFEIAPMARAAMARALGPWPDLAAEAAELLGAWPLRSLPGQPGAIGHDFASARLTLLAGDARRRLPGWGGRAEAWFLDGFAPARNPEMWEPGLLAAVAAHTVPGGTVATYSAAGAVRRGLADAGFAVEKLPGFGRKREMCRGRLPEEDTP